MADSIGLYNFELWLLSPGGERVLDAEENLFVEGRGNEAAPVLPRGEDQGA